MITRDLSYTFKFADRQRDKDRETDRLDSNRTFTPINTTVACLLSGIHGEIFLYSLYYLPENSVSNISWRQHLEKQLLFMYVTSPYPTHCKAFMILLGPGSIHTLQYSIFYLRVKRQTPQDLLWSTFLLITLFWAYNVNPKTAAAFISWITMEQMSMSMT